MKKKHWYDYLWIWSIIYFALGFFNILFAWLGMIDFLIPLGFAVFKGNKNFCNRYCGRGQLLQQLGGTYKCSRNRKLPLGCPQNGSVTAFLYFSLQCLPICCSKLGLSVPVPKVSKNLSNYFGLFAFHGAGPILPE